MRRLNSNGYSLSVECNHYFSEDYIEKIMNKLGFDKSFPVIYYEFHNNNIYDLLNLCTSFSSHDCIIVVEIDIEAEKANVTDETYKRFQVKQPIDLGFVDISKFMDPYEIYCFIYPNVYGTKILDYILKGECNKMEKFNLSVYVTYENSIRAHITGVYLDKTLATSERDKRGDLEIIDTFELQGFSNRDNYDSYLNDDCKYFSQRLEMIRTMILALYDIEGCICGGIAHVVVDDENFEDHHLQFVIDECNKEENKDRLEVPLAKVICEELLKLSMQERALLFSSYYSFACDKNCNECTIDKGSLD